MEKNDQSFTAVISSDLHYTSNPPASNPIIPLYPYVDILTKRLLETVMEIRPDAFILCGDQTGSGKEKDHRDLVHMLWKLKRKGIRIILCPGNHDYDHVSRSLYHSIYAPLLEYDDKDPESESCVYHLDQVTVISMDDNQEGTLAAGIHLNWLKDCLKKESSSGKPMIFLSHRSLLYKDDGRFFYTIEQSEEILSLLRLYNVPFVLSGHQHRQMIMEENGIHEIISSMPWMGRNLVGVLRITDSMFGYQAVPLYFDEHAWETEIQFRKNISQSYSFDRDLESLWNLFFTYESEGTVYEHKDLFLQNEKFNILLDTLKSSPYGDWIRSMVYSDCSAVKSIFLRSSSMGSGSENR